MGLQKNVASQRWIVFAFDRTTNVPKTGDAAQITAKISKDFAAAVATNDGTPDELEDGYYSFLLTQAETNADHLLILPESSTGDIQVIGVTGVICPNPAEFSDLAITGGAIDNVTLVATTTTNSDMRGTDSAALATALATAQLDLDIITDTDGVVLGAAGVDLVWDEILTGATHNIATSAGRRLRGIQEFQGYENGAVWIDTLNGTAGTVDFENGTVENPVKTMADANTIAASLNIHRFEIQSGSTITLAAAQNNQVFSGINWTLALGGQDIAGSMFHGAKGVSGIAAGTGTGQMFRACTLNAVSHIKGTRIVECGIGGTQTVVEAGDFFLDRCHSAIAGTSTPTWDFGTAIGNTNMNFRNYSGGIQLEAMGDTGTDTMSLEGRGQLIEGTCTGGTVAIRGLFTVSGITNLTLSDDARFDSVQLVDDWYDEVNTAAAHNVTSSGGKQLREAATTGLYEGGQIWIDTINGTAGTDVDENGTVDNPSNNIADATSLSVSKGYPRFKIAPGSSFTLAQGYTSYIFDGDDGAAIALGGQAITGCTFKDVTVTGIATGTGSISFSNSHIGTNALSCTLPPCHIHDCEVINNVTANAAGDYLFSSCYSGIAGTSTWSFDFGTAVGSTNLNMRAYSGGVQLESMGDTGTDTASIEGWGQVIEGTCTGGMVAIRGNFTVSGITNLTLSDDARIDVVQINAEMVDVIRTDTATELSAVPAASPALHSMVQFVYMALRNKIDVTATVKEIHNDAGTVIGTKSLSDDTITYSETKAS